MDDHETTRRRIHDLADTVQAVNIKAAVIEERQSAVKAQLDRIEMAVTSLPQRVAILETRESDARTSGAKWGAGMGAFVAAIIAGLSAVFGGAK